MPPRAIVMDVPSCGNVCLFLVAGNLSPFQRMALQMFEDCRVESLARRDYPELRSLFPALHPKPGEDACDPEHESCIRHRLAMFSRAVLDSDQGYGNKDLLDFVARFHAELAQGESSTQAIADLAVTYIARTRRQQDQSLRMHFTDTQVDNRDDNRHLWRFIEQGDKEEAFEEHKQGRAEEAETLPPRHYPEWDYKRGGATPDPRINMSHRHDGRDIAVMLLLDLSQSLNQIPDGCSQTILELSQEEVALLGWAIEHLGDEFAIAGFSSNTRYEVRYQHIKGYSEHWDDGVKAHLAAMEAGYSTRMGAALRHAAHHLEARTAEKKLLWILTDGQPHDIDVDDERLLIEDTHKAVQELDQQGIYTYCISLDAHADEYVREVFGNRFTVIDRVERLPEKLPQLFMALTK